MSETPEPADLDQLAEEFLDRRRQGESVDVETYARAHPALAGRIRDLFPVLIAMEGLSDAHHAELSPRELPEPIGAYAVQRELGRGGMGRVFEAQAPDGGRVALKVVHGHLVDRPGLLERFLREVDVGTRIDHPAVARTLDSGVQRIDGVDTPYLVLEFVEGETLRQLLAGTGPVSERLAREIGVTLADALAAVHEAGVVHRDVKPENVVIAPDERIKLMDLGVAFVHDDALRLTQTGDFVGSLLYAAPEQFDQRPLDGRTDLYALGLVLYELVAGRCPQADGSASVFARGTGRARIPKLREVAPHVTAFLEGVIDCLLQFEPAKRFASATELRSVLEEGEDGAWWRAVQDTRAPTARPRRSEPETVVIGRERELAVLDADWSVVRDGSARARVLRGEAGLGKSQLLGAWLDRLETAAPRTGVVWVEHQPGNAALGLTPIARSLHRLLGDDPEPRVRAWLAGREDRTTEVLASLQRAQEGLGAVGALDRAALETMYILLLRGMAREQPLVVAIEDLHFASSEGLALFARFVSAFAQDPVFLLATTRPHVPEIPAQDLCDLDHVEVLDLDGLQARDAFQVLQASAGEHPSPASVLHALVRKSDGNPYCLLEFGRALRARSASSDDVQSEPDVPATVRRLVEARLHALTGDDRDLLGVAACSGFRFDPVVICEAAGVPRIAGLRALHRLDREQSLVRAEGTVYRFHHHLVHESLRAELPPALFSAYHSALGAAWEARLDPSAALTDEQALALGRHFLQGDTPERATPYVVRALEHLMTLGERRRAGRMARRALEVLREPSASLRAQLQFTLGRAIEGEAPPQEVIDVFESALLAAKEAHDGALTVDVLSHLTNAMSHAGRHDLATGRIEEAVQVAEQLDDPERHADTLGEYAAYLYDMGRHDEAFAHGKRALELARASGVGARAARIAMYNASFYVESGRHEEASPLVEFALASSHVYGDLNTELYATQVLARISSTQGDVDTCYALRQRAYEIARESGNTRRLTGAELGLGAVALERGEFEEGIERLGRVVRLSTRAGHNEQAALACMPLLGALTHAGRFGDAFARMQEGKALLDLVPLFAIHARMSPVFARLLAWMGAQDEAATWIESGFEKAQKAGAPREEISLRRARAEIAETRGDAATSIAIHEEVLEQVRALDLGFDIMFVLQRLGDLYARHDRHAEARDALHEAHERAARGGVAAVVATSSAWLDVLDGNPQRVRVALERDESLIPFRAYLGLLLAIGDARARTAARERCERAIEGAPEAFRSRMRADVALYREALAG